jgi:hypothetical protein
MRTVDDPIAKALEARAVPDIEELVLARAVHLTIMTRHVR